MLLTENIFGNSDNDKFVCFTQMITALADHFIYKRELTAAHYNLTVVEAETEMCNRRLSTFQCDNL